MSRLNIEFLPAARQEFIEASRWYEAKRAGLGREFIAEIERCLTLAADRPLQFAICDGSCRHSPHCRLPFSV